MFMYMYVHVLVPDNNIPSCCIQHRRASFLHFAGCVNVFGNPDACKAYAEQGECDVNTSWMSAFCRESCFSCKYTGMFHLYHTIYFSHVTIFTTHLKVYRVLQRHLQVSDKKKRCFIASIVIFKALPDLRRQFKPV